MFYTNFIAKLKEEKLNQLEESYLFRLSYAKFMPHIIILSICLVMIPFLLIIFKKEGLNMFVGLIIVLALMSIAQIVNCFRFKFEIKNGSIFYRTFEIKLDEIKNCNLKYGVLPKAKKMEVFLDIITIKKEEKIIPLHMHNKKLFVMVLREILKERFLIIEYK